MSLYYYLNDDHSFIPCRINEWSNQIESMDRKIVKDTIIDGYLASTVWLGFDHSIEGKPLLFQTKVFDSNQKRYVLYYSFYCTWNEAVEGHYKAIQWVFEKLIKLEVNFIWKKKVTAGMNGN